MNFLKLALIVAFGAVAFALPACTVLPAENVLAPSALAQDVLAEKAPTAGKARVNFYLGQVYGKIMFLGTTGMPTPSNLIANGQVIGGVNRHELMPIDIAPGKYTFLWKERMKKGDGTESRSLTLELHAGQIVYLRADVHRTASFPIADTLENALELNQCMSKCLEDTEGYKIVLPPKS